MNSCHKTERPTPAKLFFIIVIHWQMTGEKRHHPIPDCKMMQ